MSLIDSKTKNYSLFINPYVTKHVKYFSDFFLYRWLKDKYSILKLNRIENLFVSYTSSFFDYVCLAVLNQFDQEIFNQHNSLLLKFSFSNTHFYFPLLKAIFLYNDKSLLYLWKKLNCL